MFSVSWNNIPSSLWLTLHIGYKGGDFPEHPPISRSASVRRVFNASDHIPLLGLQSDGEWTSLMSEGMGYAQLGPESRIFGIVMFHEVRVASFLQSISTDNVKCISCTVFACSTWRSVVTQPPRPRMCNIVWATCVPWRYAERMQRLNLVILCRQDGDQIQQWNIPAWIHLRSTSGWMPTSSIGLHSTQATTQAESVS